MLGAHYFQPAERCVCVVQLSHSTESVCTPTDACIVVFVCRSVYSVFVFSPVQSVFPGLLFARCVSSSAGLSGEWGMPVVERTTYKMTNCECIVHGWRVCCSCV